MLQDSTIENIITKLHTEISGAHWDIKAEALLLMAIHAGLDKEELLVGCDALFAREYSKDISLAEVKEDAQKKQMLRLHLSRTGLYDQLPQGLFYRANKSSGTEDMCEEYKYNKKKEDEIRKFFIPFENDFFLQRLQTEGQEAEILEGLKSGLLNDYFAQFWDLPVQLSKSFAAPFVLLIPYAHQIAGNMDLTTHSLEQLLKEKIVITKKGNGENRVNGDLVPGLGESTLGLDLICGETFYEDSVVLEIAVGPLKNSDITEYLEGGQRKLLIDTFAGFFIPAGVEIIITVNVAYERQHMTINKSNCPVLGYSSVLGKLQTL